MNPTRGLLLALALGTVACDGPVEQTDNPDAGLARRQDAALADHVAGDTGTVADAGVADQGGGTDGAARDSSTGRDTSAVDTSGGTDSAARDTGGADTGAGRDATPPPQVLAVETPQGSIWQGEPGPSAFPGVVGVLNVDDDDQNGTADFNDARRSTSDDDLTWLRVRAPQHQVRLSLEAESDQVRLWAGNSAVLGDQTGTTSWNAGEVETLELALEFGFMTLDHAVLTVTDLDSSSALEIELSAAPLLLNHHLQATEYVWVATVQYQDWSNAAMVQDLRSTLGNRLLTYSGSRYNDDVWIQDQIEFSTFTSAVSRLDVIMNSIRVSDPRSGGLESFAENELVEPGVATFTWGETMSGSSLDSFGNLEVTPPVEVDGVNYPMGRIYYGGQGRDAPATALTEFLEKQGVQAPFEINTTWLAVGHVDEIMTFLPDATAPRGFRLFFADTVAGWEILDAMPFRTSLPRYAPAEGWGGHGFDTVGALVASPGLRAYNEDLQDAYLDPILDLLRQELDLREAEIVLAPAVFYEWSDQGFSGALALVPSAINLLLVNNGDGSSAAVIADPFLRSNTAATTDPFIAAWEALLPAEVEAVWVDDWDVYHVGMGEVHCGTNSRRTPVANWWRTAGHLIEEGTP